MARPAASDRYSGMFQIGGPERETMATSIDELKDMAMQLRKEGLNMQQIADEMSLSQATVEWFLSSSVTSTEDRPNDVRIGWRSVGVRPHRVEAIGSIFADIVLEETNGEIDTIVGVSLNGISFAQSIAGQLDCEMSIYRNVEGEAGAGHLSDKFGRVAGKRVVVIDDVLSTGRTMSMVISHLREAGADIALLLVLVNKTTRDELEGLPLRGIIRAVTV